MVREIARSPVREEQVRVVERAGSGVQTAMGAQQEPYIRQDIPIHTFATAWTYRVSRLPVFSTPIRPLVLESLSP